jgi:hypothetical protein
MIALNDTAIRGIKPLYETNVFEIEQWCKDYERYGKYPTTLPKRFLIGLYQIQQGTGWKDMGLNKYESYCAAFIHFMCCCTIAQLDYSKNWEEISLENIPKSYYEKTAPRLLDSISRAAQQIIYGDVSNKTQRKSRFNKERAGEIMGDILWDIISLVPVEYRRDGLYQASLILIGKL